MLLENDNNVKGRNYEVFICRAFKCNKGIRFGADRRLLFKLFLLEESYKDSFKYYRSFNRLKSNIEKALCKLKKRKKYFNSQDEFMPLLLRLKKANCAEDLAKTASLGLAKIIECENRLRESG